MPRKADPWKRPDHDRWLKIGAKVVALPKGKTTDQFGLSSSSDAFGSPPSPWDSVVFVVTKIETTGNGTQMIHVTAEGDPNLTLARWWPDFRGKWIPIPRKPSVRKPRPKRERLSRFDREEPI